MTTALPARWVVRLAKVPVQCEPVSVSPESTIYETGLQRLKYISDVSREILLGVSLNTSPASSEKQIHLKYAGRQYEYG